MFLLGHTSELLPPSLASYHNLVFQQEQVYHIIHIRLSAIHSTVSPQTFVAAWRHATLSEFPKIALIIIQQNLSCQHNYYTRYNTRAYQHAQPTYLYTQPTQSRCSLVHTKGPRCQERLVRDCPSPSPPLHPAPSPLHCITAPSTLHYTQHRLLHPTPFTAPGPLHCVG